MSNTFFKLCRVRDNYENNRTTRQEIADRTFYGANKMLFACRVSKKIIRNVIIFNS